MPPSSLSTEFWENWYVIGENDPGSPEFKFIYYNGKTRQNTYDGAFVYSRSKTLEPESMAKVYSVAKEERRRRKVAAAKIQAVWRHHRFCLNQLLLDDDAMTSFVYSQLKKGQRVDSATKLQSTWRGRSWRKWWRRWYDDEVWLEDDFEPVQVYPPHHDDHVAVKRSVPRVDGEIAFDVTYADGPNKGYWQRVPITLFMDFDDLTFSHQAVADAVNDWVQTASEFPKTRRNCICCNIRAEKGKILCRGCIPKYQAIIDAE